MHSSQTFPEAFPRPHQADAKIPIEIQRAKKNQGNFEENK